jgi:hypothetical protein
MSKVGQTGATLADILGRVNAVAGAIVGNADSEAVGVAEAVRDAEALPVAEPLRVCDPLVEFPNRTSSQPSTRKESPKSASSAGHSSKRHLKNCAVGLKSIAQKHAESLHPVPVTIE